jgi:hypothetical protein
MEYCRRELEYTIRAMSTQISVAGIEITNYFTSTIGFGVDEVEGGRWGSSTEMVPVRVLRNWTIDAICPSERFLSSWIHAMVFTASSKDQTFPS